MSVEEPRGAYSGKFRRRVVTGADLDKRLEQVQRLLAGRAQENANLRNHAQVLMLKRWRERHP